MLSPAERICEADGPTPSLRRVYAGAKGILQARIGFLWSVKQLKVAKRGELFLRLHFVLQFCVAHGTNL
jgi:hypothetical protein